MENEKKICRSPDRQWGSEGQHISPLHRPCTYLRTAGIRYCKPKLTWSMRTWRRPAFPRCSRIQASLRHCRIMPPLLHRDRKMGTSVEMRIFRTSDRLCTDESRVGKYRACCCRNEAPLSLAWTNGNCLRRGRQAAPMGTRI